MVFFNYQPNFFYSLAAANGYKILGVYINHDGFCGDLTPYSDELMKFIKLPDPLSSVMFLLVSLQKTTKDEFRPPWSSHYIGSCDFDKYKFQKTTEYFLPVPTKELSARNHFDELKKKVRQMGFLSAVKRYFFIKFSKR